MLAELFGVWEIALMLAVIVILLAARPLPGPGQDMTSLRSDHEPLPRPSLPFNEAVILWVAQGFGSGRAPFAPGTFGSLVGLLWVMALLMTGSFWGYVFGTAWGLTLSVLICGSAERILRQHDPSSVVLDEIAAMPICFLPWAAVAWFRFDALPTASILFDAKHWYWTVILFALFRLFDVAKPWPVRQSQRLPGGWGVTADDVLAATYVALLSLRFLFSRAMTG